MARFEKTHFQSFPLDLNFNDNMMNFVSLFGGVGYGWMILFWQNAYSYKDALVDLSISSFRRKMLNITEDEDAEIIKKAVCYGLIEHVSGTIYTSNGVRRRMAVMQRERDRAYKRVQSVKQRTPAWADRKAIKDFYRNCPPGMTVDHIIPLNGKLVSGLHMVGNLQYLSHSENSCKGNRFKPQPKSIDGGSHE
jgi:hypothetical protein